jgi:beta-ketodecanoyl-[acyl-carrier-protein] synthase
MKISSSMPKEGILNIRRMRPKFPERKEDESSNQAEIAVYVARLAMAAAGKTASYIDAVIVSCAYTQRAYPAIAFEVQHALGIEGFGFDMQVACSARRVLAINLELDTPQANYCDRDTISFLAM